MSGTRGLDFYRVIIIASLGLLPVVGGWAYWLNKQLDTAHTAIATATKAGGDLEQIGKFQNAIQKQRRANVTAGSDQDTPSVYFDRWIMRSNKTDSLKREDFSIQTVDRMQPAGKGAQDRLVEISFKRGGREAFALTREFLLAVLFNCEGQSPAWKLRELDIGNATLDDRAFAGGKAPPEESADEWKVNKMVFASRVPDTRQR